MRLLIFVYSAQDIKDAKLSLFSSIDKKIEPQNKGLRTWIYGMYILLKIKINITLGISDEMRSEYRNGLLSVTKQVCRLNYD